MIMGVAKASTSQHHFNDHNILFLTPYISVFAFKCLPARCQQEYIIP